MGCFGIHHFLFSQAIHYVNSTLLITKHYTTYKEHKEQLFSPMLGDLGKGVCPGKTEDLVATDFSVEYLSVLEVKE